MLLNVENLHKSFAQKHLRHTVLGGVNFSVDAGQFILVRGKSGAGKSVLLSILAGIERPSSGRICLADKDIHTLRDTELARIRARDIRLVFQNHNLIDDWTVMDNLLAADIRPGQRAEKLDRASRLLRRFDMLCYRNDYPIALSMGQRMRVVIARAMMVTPKVLLADEPTGELDARNAEVVSDYLRELAGEENIAVIVASHGHFPSRHADRVLALNRGKLLPAREADVCRLVQRNRAQRATGVS